MLKAAQPRARRSSNETAGHRTHPRREGRRYWGRRKKKGSEVFIKANKGVILAAGGIDKNVEIARFIQQ
jgi:choline dehydrogenase-like flavoprotein